MEITMCYDALMLTIHTIRIKNYMEIEIYTISGCEWCDRTIKLMAMAEITDYKKYMVGVDVTKQSVKEKFPAANGYPIIVIDNQIYDIISTAKLFVERGLVSSKKK
jgi:glutaredoxin 3